MTRKGHGPFALWPSPFGEAFLEEVGRVRRSLFIVAPYVRSGGVARVIDRLRSNPGFHDLEIRVLTRLDQDAFQGRHSHPEALLALLELGERGGPRVEMRWRPNLHAKVYVFDGARALVTSANLTEDSLFPETGSGDVEYGVLIESMEAVRLVVGHLEETWAGAEAVSVRELKGLIRRGKCTVDKPGRTA